MTERTKNEPVTKPISDSLQSYQDAAQRLLDVLVRAGSPNRSADGTEPGGHRADHP